MKILPILLLALTTIAVSASPKAFAQTGDCAQYTSNPKYQWLLEPPPSSIPGSVSHVYKSSDGLDLRVHVFQPAGFDPNARPAPGKLPAIVFFFGGAWMVGAVTEFVPQARYFAERGMVAIIVDYRVFCRNKSSIVDEMADARSAIRWVRSHARELGVDPNRLAASGASSGGHIALSTAVFSEWDDPSDHKAVSARPNLLVLFYPCVDETTQEEKAYGGDAIGTHGKDVSPLYHLDRRIPPTIIFQGTADTLYPEVKSYCTQARAGGNRCEFVEYPDAPHGFFNPLSAKGKWYDEALPAMDRYLTAAGYLPRRP